MSIAIDDGPTVSQSADGGLSTRGIRLRIVLFVLIVSCAFAAILLRAHRLQVGEGARLRGMAEQQYLKQIELAPRRGTIYDRHGAALALSVDVDSVYANPRVVGDRAAEVARRLSRLLDVDRRTLLHRLTSLRYFVWVKRRISPQLAKRVRSLGLRGVSLQKESRRFYPNRTLASSVIGFAGLDGKGLEGIERSLNGWLRGSSVRIAGLRDALGRPLLADGVAREPTAGYDVVLSLDKLIQYETERVLEQVYKHTQPQRGWAAAIVMDPRNGDILAMASKPDFDPNRFGSAKPRQWRNRIVADAFEPGSTLKLYTVAGALAAGAIQPDERIYCEAGHMKIGRHVIHDTKPHDWLSVADVLKKSSNVGATKLAMRLGRKRLYRMLRRFGFAQRTGIALPGERAGVLRKSAAWSDIALANIAFGQGMTTTALQLATALSALGNGGLRMRPRLVLRIQDGDGNVVERVPSQGERVISEQLSRSMLSMMRGVTEKGGTGEQAALERYSVAGKTGTAQKVDPTTGGYSRNIWLSSFVGLVPATAPRLAIVVVVNEPVGGKYYGGEVAGPVFRRIASRSLRYLGVTPDLARDESPSIATQTSPDSVGRDARSVAREQAPPLPGPSPVRARIVVPDFTGMSMGQVLSSARRAGLAVSLEGSGRVVAQSPGPGPVPDGTVCRIALEPPG